MRKLTRIVDPAKIEGINVGIYNRLLLNIL